MAAHRKNPPDGASEDIQRLASQGFGQLGIAAHFSVSRETFKRWIEEDEALNEAYDLGKETERQALHALVVQSAVMNKPANVNAFFLLKARHGYVETDNRTKVSVDVAVNNVLVVRDHGTDEQWAAKCAAQQRALITDCTTPHQIEASTASQVDAVASFEPPAYLTHASEQQAAPVASYAPPGYNGQPEAIRSAPVAPSWRPEWRPRA